MILYPYLYVLLPFAILSQGNFNNGHRVSLMIGGCAVVAQKIKNDALRWFVYYVLAQSVVYLVLILYGGLKHWFDPTTYVISILIGVYIIINIRHLKKETVVKCVCIAAVVQSLLALMQSDGFDPYYLLITQATDVQRVLELHSPTGLLGNNNFLTAFLALSFPFFLHGFWVLYTPILLWVLFIGDTTTAVVSLLAGCMFLVGKKAIVPLLVIAILYAFVVDLNFCDADGFYDYRFGEWHQVFKLILPYPAVAFWGYGAGAKWSNTVTHNIHNEYISTLFYFGVPGLFLALYFIKDMFLAADRTLKAALIILAVNCMGNYPLHTVPTALLAITIIGLCYARLYDVPKHIPSS